VANHVARAKLMLEKAQVFVRAGDLDPVEGAMVAAMSANAEATLALVEQQRLSNEITLFTEATYDGDLNPTDMTVADWKDDLYRRVQQ
jgi:hypothetical protein